MKKSQIIVFYSSSFHTKTYNNMYVLFGDMLRYFQPVVLCASPAWVPGQHEYLWNYVHHQHEYMDTMSTCGTMCITIMSTWIPWVPVELCASPTWVPGHHEYLWNYVHQHHEYLDTMSSCGTMCIPIMSTWTPWVPMKLCASPTWVPGHDEYLEIIWHAPENRLQKL